MNWISLLGAVMSDYRRSWKELALTDIAYKIITFIILTPLVGVVFRVFMSVSGRSVLADEDILFFFLGPAGWACFVVVGALTLGIVALEQAALMGVLCAASDRRRMPFWEALRFAGANGRPVLLVAARLLAWTLLTAAPFLAAAGLIYVALLGEYDINYYLQEKPPVFWVAISLGGVVGATLVTALLYLVSGWFLALPLVLFEQVSARRALRISRERTKGRRRMLALWIAGWTVATLAFSTFATSLILFFGRLVVPRATGSLPLLAAAVGVTLVLWAGVNLTVNLFSATTFAAILFRLYQDLGRREGRDVSLAHAAETAATKVRFRLTRYRLLGAGVLGVALAGAVGVVAIRSVRLEDHTEIMAHRGSSAAAPENTMAAVLKAIEDKADWVEIDVQETADGEVVVFHDSDFMKLARVNLQIWDATMAELEDIDIGGWFAPEFRDQRTPTLRNVLRACKGRIRVNIELKYYGHDERLEQRVVDVVEGEGMESDIIVMSLKSDAVKKMKALRPGWKVGLLTSVAVGDLTNTEADFLAVNVGLASRAFIRLAHDRGKEVYVWTVNDAPTMSTMISRNVDSLITDRPALARSVLEQRAGMSAPERLLLELAAILGVAPEIGEP